MWLSNSYFSHNHTMVFIQFYMANVKSKGQIGNGNCLYLQSFNLGTSKVFYIVNYKWVLLVTSSIQTRDSLGWWPTEKQTQLPSEVGKLPLGGITTPSPGTPRASYQTKILPNTDLKTNVRAVWGQLIILQAQTLSLLSSIAYLIVVCAWCEINVYAGVLGQKSRPGSFFYRSVSRLLNPETKGFA